MADVVKKVTIDSDECISCEACVASAPDVFEMQDDKATLKPEAQNPEFLKAHSDSIIEAAEACPVSAIKIEKE